MKKNENPSYTTAVVQVGTPWGCVEKFTERVWYVGR